MMQAKSEDSRRWTPSTKPDLPLSPAQAGLFLPATCAARSSGCHGTDAGGLGILTSLETASASKPCLRWEAPRQLRSRRGAFLCRRRAPASGYDPTRCNAGLDDALEHTSELRLQVEAPGRPTSSPTQS